LRHVGLPIVVRSLLLIEVAGGGDVNDATGEIQGMTVNERLFHFGALGAFDRAVSSRHNAEVIRVLLNVKFTEAQAIDTATAILANPERYGD